MLYPFTEEDIDSTTIKTDEDYNISLVFTENFINKMHRLPMMMQNVITNEIEKTSKKYLFMFASESTLNMMLEDIKYKLRNLLLN